MSQRGLEGRRWKRPDVRRSVIVGRRMVRRNELRWVRMGGRGTLGEPRAQFRVVGGAALGGEQADASRRDFIQQPLRVGGLLRVLEGPQMRHLAIRGEADHVVVGLEELDSQQPVMVGRLFPWRDSEPVVVGVEVHVASVTTGFAC